MGMQSFAASIALRKLATASREAARASGSKLCVMISLRSFRLAAARDTKSSLFRSSAAFIPLNLRQTTQCMVKYVLLQSEQCRWLQLRFEALCWHNQLRPRRNLLHEVNAVGVRPVG